MDGNGNRIEGAAGTEFMSVVTWQLGIALTKAIALKRADADDVRVALEHAEQQRDVIRSMRWREAAEHYRDPPETQA